MKKITYIILTLFVLMSVSCNDSFLDRDPTHNLNQNKYWNTADDLKVFSNGLYDLMAKNDNYLFYTGYGNKSMWSAEASFLAVEAQTDNFASGAAEHQSFTQIAAGQETVRTGTTGIHWQWELLRRCNMMLENYEKANIAETLRNQFAGEAYFIRAWFYLDKVQRYGDVPFISSTLNTDSPELYGERTPRKQVMDSVLVDINKAIEFLPDNWGSEYPDRIDKWMGLALKSRICLYEGTFRKYHGLGDHEIFLTQSVDAAEKLMASKKFSIYNTGKPESDYKSIFMEDDLASNPEAIMVRKYNEMHFHKVPRYTTELKIGVTKDLVDDFLCLEPDGTAKPIKASTVYKDQTIEQVFDNRDPRMAQIILDPRDEEKVYRSEYGYPRLIGMSGIESTTGYHFIKYYDFDQAASNIGTSDAPIIRYAEVLLNYAEARYELGKLTQTDLDNSINLIRKRAGMPPLTMNPEMDPKYKDEGISALLVEIRRERRIELCFEQQRYQDLMRWKKGNYLAKPVLGMRFEESDRNSDRYTGAAIQTRLVDGKNYIDVFAGSDYSNRTFNDAKHYYHPIPTDAISLNPKIKQNPNW